MKNPRETLLANVKKAEDRGQQLDVTDIRPEGTYTRLRDRITPRSGRKTIAGYEGVPVDFPIISKDYTSFKMAMDILGPEFDEYSRVFLRVYGEDDEKKKTSSGVAGDLLQRYKIPAKTPFRPAIPQGSPSVVPSTRPKSAISPIKRVRIAEDEPIQERSRIARRATGWPTQQVTTDARTTFIAPELMDVIRNERIEIDEEYAYPLVRDDITSFTGTRSTRQVDPRRQGDVPRRITSTKASPIRRQAAPIDVEPVPTMVSPTRVASYSRSRQAEEREQPSRMRSYSTRVASPRRVAKPIDVEPIPTMVSPSRVIRREEISETPTVRRAISPTRQTPTVRRAISPLRPETPTVSRTISPTRQTPTVARRGISPTRVAAPIDVELVPTMTSQRVEPRRMPQPSASRLSQQSTRDVTATRDVTQDQPTRASALMGRRSPTRISFSPQAARGSSPTRASPLISPSRASPTRIAFRDDRIIEETVPEREVSPSRQEANRRSRIQSEIDEDNILKGQPTLEETFRMPRGTRSAETQGMPVNDMRQRLRELNQTRLDEEVNRIQPKTILVTRNNPNLLRTRVTPTSRHVFFGGLPSTSTTSG